MRILIDIGHPAHVHLYRNLYAELISKGHEVYVTVRNIKTATDLLDIYDIPYIILGNKSDSIFRKGFEQIKFDLRIVQIFRKYSIDIAISSPFNIAHAAIFSGTVSIMMDDDDDGVQPLMTRFGHPFAGVVLSPEAVRNNRKVRTALFYPGYHELAYLHPNRFRPAPAVIKEAGLKECEPFFIMRFNVFKAHHDIGINGLSLPQKLELIELLRPYGKIFITSERNIEPELQAFQYKMDPDKIHHFLYYARMFIGDSQTMTSEAAVLGTPAIRCNSLAGRISYLEEEEHKYSLTFGFTPDKFDKMKEKIITLLETSDLKEEWNKRRERMLKDKIDVTAFMVWFIENYPESVKLMKENPDYQYRFK